MVGTTIALTSTPASGADGNVVRDGKARFTVLSPTLVRMEYADDERFEDRGTFNAVNRTLPTPDFTTTVENGQRVIRTDKLTLRYEQGSGPFTPANLSVDLKAGARNVTAKPDFGSVCAYGIGCEVERQILNGNAGFAADHLNYSGDGFVDGVDQVGSQAAWTTSGVPAAGEYTLHLRYANGVGTDLAHKTRTLTLTAGGASKQVSLPKTAADWNGWAVATTTVQLNAGDNAISLACKNEDTCHVNLDSVAVTAKGAAYAAPPEQPANLGGYRRSLDGQAGAAKMFDGLLSKDGWHVIDDTQTAILKSDGTIEQRPDRGGKPYQDGYFFGYGHDYKQGLKDLRAVTGPAPLLPHWAFGVWYSRWEIIADAQYRNVILPAFRANKAPLDMLIVDTDWKAPNPWTGWNWNPLLFPNPRSFVDWTKQQGLQLGLNVHPSIVPYDQKFAQTEQTAGKPLAQGQCLWVPLTCKVFDWSDPKQLQAYHDLHDPFEDEGVRLWWLDWCCETSKASARGITPDTFINAEYARRAEAKGERGFVLSRGMSAYAERNGKSPVYPSGPWAEHRYLAHFTGDTTTGWPALAAQPTFTAQEGNVGIPYVTHDIGGFNGFPSGDLYARWVQLGAFQPIMRLHGNHAPRLPWEFLGEAKDSALKFLRLRESLVPYSYTLAQEAYETGVPMVRSMYLDYPESAEAYTFDKQYLYGSDVLVAPVTKAGAGNVDTSVWFPPGEWTDYFTGKTYTGPSTQTVTTSLSTMPVFLRSGGLLPTRTDYVDSANAKPLDQVTLDVAAGADGSSSLYEDAGEGHGHRSGESARTALSFADGSHAVTIAARAGSYPGAVASRTWTVRFRNVSAAASRATVNGAEVPSSYDATTRTLTVKTGALPVSGQTVVAYTP